jgi:ribosomal protein S18 acetylase RimI-like enzyme
MNILYEENTLTAKQFLFLRESVGWKGIELQIEKALKCGLYNVSAKGGDEVIGMGRLVGDGVMYWYVQDVIINPQYQRKGVGKEIMRRLTQHIKKNSLPNTTVTIGLMASKDKEDFYEKLGYIARPTESYGPGMIKHYEIPNV